MEGEVFSETKQIQVKFFTNTFPKKVTDTPFAVPEDLTRYGLSELINVILDLDPPTPFDFLIENEFLRTSLSQYLSKRGLTSETVLLIEYVEAQPAPKAVDNIPHDDWISYIGFVTNSEHNYLLTGCYDKFVRVIDNDGNIISLAKHDQPIRDLALVPSRPADGKSNVTTTESHQFSFVSVSRDEIARLWTFDARSQQSVNRLVLKGHAGPLESVSVNVAGTMACTGSADKTIKLWDLTALPDFTVGSVSENETETEPPSKKRKRASADTETTAPSSVSQITRIPLGTLTGHLLGVSAVHWGTTANIFSSSWDHTIRIWDVTTGACSQTINGNKVANDLAVAEASGNLLLSAHPDKVVRLWDPRATFVTPTTFRSHKAWVRQVQWSPTHEHQFISCADDSTAKLWDKRSAIPLCTITHDDVRPDTKVLAVAWGQQQNGRQLFTGGSDCKLRRHAFSA